MNERTVSDELAQFQAGVRRLHGKQVEAKFCELLELDPGRDLVDVLEDALQGVYQQQLQAADKADAVPFTSE